MHIDFEYIQ